jgi:tRNA threonylcarbamoyl adenosine modification protein (Sua5/YciO/YrdC/YwlC family)
MECLPFTKENLQKAVRILRKGDVIAHPADTCYGLAADLMNPEAVKKAQDIKGRERNKPMSIMLPAFMQPEIGRFAKLDDFSEDICNKLLPGPVTILLPKGSRIPDYFFPESPIIGIRIPYDMITQDLLTAFRGPLITTSANLSNQPPLSTCEEVKKIFRNRKHKPDILFDGTVRNKCLPSTVILVKDKKIKIMREGPITKKQLEGILGMKIS